MVTDRMPGAPASGAEKSMPGAATSIAPRPRPTPGRHRPSPGPRAAGGSPTRYGALDGLRGFAAVVVLVHHAFLGIPNLAGPYDLPARRATGVGWVLTYTPLHLIWAGTEAVYVFFVLSGFVLVLPLMRGRAFSWRAYYPKRLARLYLPIWGALALAAVIVAAVPRDKVSGASWWLNHHHEAVTVKSWIVDAFSIFGADQLNSALWSLRWEVLFSLGLPAYVLVCRKVFPHRFLLLKLLVTVGIACLGQATLHQALTIAPTFLLGALLAADRQVVAAWASRLTPAAGAGLATLAGLGLVAPWLASIPGRPGRAVGVVGLGLQLIAASLIVVLFMAWGPAVRAGTSVVGRWLGRRSFSLYLVHEPIVVSVALLLGPHHVVWTLLIAGPIALVVADLFFRIVEGPSHRFSRWIGARVGGKRGGGAAAA